MLKSLINPEVQSTLVTDILSLSQDQVHNNKEQVEDFMAQKKHSATPLPEALEACFIKSFDQLLDVTVLLHIAISGITYLTSWKHLAHIGYIMQVDFEDNDDSCTVTYVAAWKYKPADVHADPFASFPLLQVQLWSQKLGDL
ncbi:hypothetical protein CVT25_002007, partial [Psilocybe cyanescens]